MHLMVGFCSSYCLFSPLQCMVFKHIAVWVRADLRQDQSFNVGTSIAQYLSCKSLFVYECIDRD